MIEADYIPQAEEVKLFLAKELNTNPEFIHLVGSRADALITLLSFYSEQYQTKKIIASHSLGNTAKKIKFLSKNSEIETLGNKPLLEQLTDLISPNSLVMLSNPSFPDGCLVAVKRIINFCERVQSHAVFDLSLSYFWLGYDLGNTNLYPAILSLNPYAQDSSPVAIIARHLPQKFIFGQIKDWPYKINIPEADRAELIQTFTDYSQQLDNILVKVSLHPSCKKNIIILRTYRLPDRINISHLSAILQYSQLQHIMDTKGKFVTIKIPSINPEKLKTLEALIDKLSKQAF